MKSGVPAKNTVSDSSSVLPSAQGSKPFGSLNNDAKSKTAPVLNKSVPTTKQSKVLAAKEIIKDVEMIDESAQPTKPQRGGSQSTVRQANTKSLGQLLTKAGDARKSKKSEVPCSPPSPSIDKKAKSKATKKGKIES